MSLYHNRRFYAVLWFTFYAFQCRESCLRRLLSQRKHCSMLNIRCHPKRHEFFIKKMALAVLRSKYNFFCWDINFPLSYSSASAKLSFAAKDIKKFIGFRVYMLCCSLVKGPHAPSLLIRSARNNIFIAKLTFSIKGDLEMKVNFKKLQILWWTLTKLLFANQQKCNFVDVLWLRAALRGKV